MSARAGRRTAICLGFALLALPGVALADPKDDARRHFTEGLAAAQAGNYDLALQHFLAAQEAYPVPATVYNIAKAYDDLGDYKNALVYFRLFREQVPEKAADVDPLIAGLEAKLAPTAGAAPPAPVEKTTVVLTGASEADLQQLRDLASQLQNVVAGTSDAEIQQRRELAAELDALSGEMARQAKDKVAATEPTPPSGEPAPVEPAPVAPATPAAPESAFISEAYEKVVVSASRVGLAPLDSPSSVSILSADDIHASPSFMIPDALRRVVGVDEMNLSGTQTDVSIRGFNRELNNKVLVLIDGRSVYTDLVGTTLWAGLPITLDEIDRIEVIRGPGSAVYGANAVTGVINIITKNPGENDEKLARLDAGTPGLVRASALAMGHEKGVAYRMTAAYSQHGRWTKDTAISDASPVVPLLDDQDLAMQTVTADARVDRPFGERGLASVTAGLATGTYEFYNIGALGDYGMTANQYYARGDLAWNPVHLRVFWNGLEGTTGPWFEPVGQNQTLTTDLRNDVVDTEVEAPLTFDTGPVHHSLNVGLGWRHKRFQFGYLEGGFDVPYDEDHYAVFVNEAATLAPVTLVGSLRVDKHPLIPIDQTISPRASVIVRVFDKTSVRATAGTSFRAPTPIESYMRFDLPSSSANGVYVEDFGNKNLRPEGILTLEAGIHDESTLYHMADVVVFYNRLTNLIGLEPVALAPNFFSEASDGFEIGETGWANLDPVYNELGAEVDTEFYPLDGLDLYANLALTSIGETTDGTRVQDQSTSLAKVNGGVTYRTKSRIDLTLAGHYVSPQVWRLREFDAIGDIEINEAPLAARFLGEARAAVRPFAKDDLELAINAWNFTALFRGPSALTSASQSLEEAQAAGAATAVPGDGVADWQTVQTYQEHPKGQPLGARLFGTIAWKF